MLCLIILVITVVHLAGAIAVMISEMIAEMIGTMTDAMIDAMIDGMTAEMIDGMIDGMTAEMIDGMIDGMIGVIATGTIDATAVERCYIRSCFGGSFWISSPAYCCHTFRFHSSWDYVSDVFRRQNAATITPQMLKDYILQDAARIDEKGNKILASDNIKPRIKSTFNLMYDYAVLSQIITINAARQFSLKGIQGKIEKQRKHKVPIADEHETALRNNLGFGCTRMILINIYTGWRPKELKEGKMDDLHASLSWDMKSLMSQTNTIHTSISFLICPKKSSKSKKGT